MRKQRAPSRVALAVCLVLPLAVLPAAPRSSMKEMKVSCVQLRTSADIGKNTAAIVKALETEAAAGSRLVVFHETGLSSYHADTVRHLTAARIDEALDAVCEACRRLDIYAVVGAPYPGDGKWYNNAYVIGPIGQIVKRYTKLHVVNRFFTDGNKLAIFYVDDVPATIMICHDERYPEIFRIPVLAGAKVGIYISSESLTPKKRDNYRCQIIARAVENQISVIHCNEGETAPGCGYPGSHGNSRIIDPAGNVLARADGAAPQTIRAVIHPARSSNGVARRGAGTPSLRAFWAEGLRVLQIHNPVFFGRRDGRIQVASEVPEGIPRIKGIRAVTHGPEHHFFGYYGICPWDAGGRRLACMESDFGDRLVAPGEKARICLVDVKTGSLRHLAEVSAWNFQQGAMVHWLPPPGGRIIYNDRVGGELRGVILDVDTGEKRAVSRPVAAVAHDGRTAVSLNFDRLRTTRPGYGYAGGRDPFADDPHPARDGLYLVDLATGRSKLIVSLDAAFREEAVPPGSEKNLLWFNHVLYSRGDTRIFFMARIHDARGRRQTAAFTVSPDGSGLRCVLPYSWGASHYDWLSDTELMVTTKYRGKTPWLHVLFKDGAPLDGYEPVAPGTLKEDGHCTFSPDGKWLASDGYGRMRPLYLASVTTRKAALAGRFHEPPRFQKDWRCDLHSRWSRDSKRLCIDSTLDGTRQVYVIDLDLPPR